MDAFARGFHFISYLFQIVYLLLLFGPPEIAVHPPMVVLVALHPFGNDEILPQRPYILPHLRGSIVSYQGIPYAIVIKVYLAAGLEFVAQVARKRGQTEYDIALLQQVDVAFHRLAIHRAHLTQFIIRHLRPHLISQCPQQSLQFVGVLDTLPRENVLIQIGIGQQFEYLHLEASASLSVFRDAPPSRQTTTGTSGTPICGQSVARSLC